jgi:hypothetical protein
VSEKLPANLRPGNTKYDFLRFSSQNHSSKKKLSPNMLHRCAGAIHQINKQLRERSPSAPQSKKKQSKKK